MYEASQAGVQVKLIIRGICCLKPGIPGISDNIEVVSIVGRLLEHSRIYYFYNNGKEKIYLSSADMMTRNMIKRVEILFPILDKRIARRLVDFMHLQLSDNQKGRYQDASGVYHYVKNELAPINSQEYLMREAQEYGLALSKQNMIETGQPVRAKRNWMDRVKGHLKRK